MLQEASEEQHGDRDIVQVRDEALVANFLQLQSVLAPLAHLLIFQQLVQDLQAARVNEACCISGSLSLSRRSPQMNLTFHSPCRQEKHKTEHLSQNQNGREWFQQLLKATLVGHLCMRFLAHRSRVFDTPALFFPHTQQCTMCRKEGRVALHCATVGNNAYYLNHPIS